MGGGGGGGRERCLLRGGGGGGERYLENVFSKNCSLGSFRPNN